MKIVSPQRSTPLRGTAKSSGAASSAAFKPDFGESDAASASGVSGVASLTAIDSLLAVQGVQAPDDALTGRRRAIADATETLDILDEIKLGLLAGELPAGKLQRLLETVERERETLDDPGLNDVLDHIELRARVELAKHGQI
ncbi:MAG: flagellar assembly protein FliX [Parvibaculaceae bacterium]